MLRAACHIAFDAAPQDGELPRTLEYVKRDAEIKGRAAEIDWRVMRLLEKYKKVPKGAQNSSA